MLHYDRNLSTNNTKEALTELYKISPAGHVPLHITRPPYADTGTVPDPPYSTEIKTEKQIAHENSMQNSQESSQCGQR